MSDCFQTIYKISTLQLSEIKAADKVSGNQKEKLDTEIPGMEKSGINFTEKMKSQYHDTENKTPKLQYIIAFWRFRVGYFIHIYPRISCFCPTDIVLPCVFLIFGH